MYNSRQLEMLEQSGIAPETMSQVTLGTVVDTNDPQQMGRVRVICPFWGDKFSTPIEDIPWATYMTPFGGNVAAGSRGPGIQQSEGGVSYGMWAIPKVGARVAIMCIDGDPQYRIYLGCVYEQFSNHTMPHGRWMYDDHPELEKSGDQKPLGPYTSREKLISPASSNFQQAFGHIGEPNYEWRTRAGDYTVSAVDTRQLDKSAGKVADDKAISHDGWVSTQGYAESRLDSKASSSYTDKNYDSPVYSWTTPGFHAFSMDDRQENCRIRIRTVGGHQIIFDDTNERIYISTAKGENWIELDEDGNIDMYTSNKLNVRAEKGINFTTDKDFRVYAKTGIHLISEADVRVQSATDTHLKVGQNLRVHAGQTLYLQADQAIHGKAGDSLFLESSSELNIRSGSELKLAGGSSVDVNAGGNFQVTAPEIHFNGPTAAMAGSAESASEEKAKFTSRVPAHEPWARTSTKDDFTHEPEFDYTNKEVNRSERGETKTRGMFWRR